MSLEEDAAVLAEVLCDLAGPAFVAVAAPSIEILQLFRRDEMKHRSSYTPSDKRHGGSETSLETVLVGPIERDRVSL